MSKLAICLLLALAFVVEAAGPPTKPRHANLPHSASSLGACVADGWLYIYGGHTGKTHTYSTKTATGSFLRIRISGGKWEELPSGPAMQGMALVAHKNKIYRIGGMQPRNAPDATADNHSLTSVACYDPTSRKWSNMPDLPSARSSHDAAFVGNKLYVLGGWLMNGARAPVWSDKVDILDLDSPKPAWTRSPQPFERRALSAVALGDKILVVGGLTAKGTTKKVDILDTKSGKWSQGPELVGETGVGFSPAACVVGQTVYVSGNDGKVLRLDNGKKWHHTATQKVARFVHRIVPGNDGLLIVVGGAAHEGNAKLVEEVMIGEQTE